MPLNRDQTLSYRKKQPLFSTTKVIQGGKIIKQKFVRVRKYTDKVTLMHATITFK